MLTTYLEIHAACSVLLLLTFAIYKGGGKSAPWGLGLFVSALGPFGFLFLPAFP